ncbi:MAG TPA: MBL fold metallo-hydrolase [Candidatus Methanomethylophilaceae archaeon]|nr:MBL fold metallo-hydrolase [Candidatus Methanomethylophilaceae archaeon]
MKVHVLVENSSKPDGPTGEHGLSLYIEMKKQVILFDTGQGDRFVNNAKIMNIDLSEVDLAVISHGHYDHGGGIKAFLIVNKYAPIYIHSRAFEPHLSLKADGRYADIGLDSKLKSNDRMILVNEDTKITNNTLLFCDVENNHSIPWGNQGLLTGTEKDPVPDDFEHEQNLILKENGKIVLITGCSHRGIWNIVTKAKEIIGRYPDTIIGGFHLHRWSGDEEELKDIQKLSEMLLSTGSQYYACHCTGKSAYEQMKLIMTDNLQTLETGTVLDL